MSLFNGVWVLWSRTTAARGRGDVERVHGRSVDGENGNRRKKRKIYKDAEKINCRWVANFDHMHALYVCVCE